MKMNRRHMLGAGAALGLSPLLGSFLRQAHAEGGSEKPFLVVFTDGNGWGHQGMDRRGELLDSPNLASPSNWEMPEVLAELGPYKDRLSILRNLNNPGDRSLHGSGWSTLNGIKGDGRQASGPSIDRLIARGAFASEPFDSIALAVSPRRDRTPPCTSSDDRQRPYPALGSPLDAYSRLFGAAQGQDPKEALSRQRSLLDGMMADVKRTKSQLVGPELAKLEQLLESQRALERQLAGQIAAFENGTPPTFPGDPEQEQMQDGRISSAVIEAYMSLTAQAFGFGLTHVAHISVLGFDAHNVGWGFLNGEYEGEHGGDAHENLSHVSGMYTKQSATTAFFNITDFKARQIRGLFEQLAELPYGSGSVLDSTVFLWVNSGGGKHHDGGARHPIVMLGGAAGLEGGAYHDFPQKQHSVNEVFTAIAQGFGVEVDCIGDAEDCPGPLAELLQ